MGAGEGSKGGMLSFESLKKIFVLRTFSGYRVPLSALNRKSTQDKKLGKPAEQW